ncbi:MAG: hypothetical protein DHS20C21_02900 [Gemmatimonadota bacterium]|nr:MAG: hypothetical protein DHS20C21_02900 [Gemmatimonadota bacterium]
MRFVHLAPRSSVIRIRKSGISSGNGCHGRGVYCVPLLELPRVSIIRQEDPYCDRTIESDPISIAEQWKWLFSPDCTHGHSARPVAVVFFVPRRLWPVDLILAIRVRALRSFLSGANGAEGYMVNSDERKAVREILQSSALQDCNLVTRIEVASASGMGKAINRFRELGGTVFSSYDDTIEVVVRGRIPSKCITRLVALSQTNQEWQSRREREWGD